MSESFRYTEYTPFGVDSGLTSGDNLRVMSFVKPTLSDGVLSTTLTGVKWDGESGSEVDVGALREGVDPPDASYNTSPRVASERTTPPAAKTILTAGDGG